MERTGRHRFPREDPPLRGGGTVRRTVGEAFPSPTAIGHTRVSLFSKAPSGRELPPQAGEGECEDIPFTRINRYSRAAFDLDLSFRHAPSGRATASACGWHPGGRLWRADGEGFRPSLAEGDRTHTGFPPFLAFPLGKVSAELARMTDEGHTWGWNCQGNARYRWDG